MVLENHEIDGDNMIITKTELEGWRDHYYKLSCHHHSNHDSFRAALYAGKHSVICDILKMFEPLEG